MERGAIRARFRRGVFEPLEKIELPEGQEVTVTIVDVGREHDPDAFARSHGAWTGTIDAEALIRNIRESRQVGTLPEARI